MATEENLSILSFNNVSKSFGGLKVLNDLTFRIKEKTITGLVGPNGAGKTTLFNAITGFLRPDEGTIKLKGKTISGLAPYKIASLGVARTFQDVRILPRMTVLENVLLFIPHLVGESPQSAVFLPKKRWKDKENTEYVMELLERVDLADKHNWLASRLSYAEQKRVLVARLMASPGELVLLDEIASGLDRQQLKTMLDYVEELRKLGKTLIVIEHNLDVIKGISDNILFLNHGTLIASGKPDELWNNPELAEIYFGKEGVENARG